MKNRFAVALAGALMLAALVPASAASHINERDHIRHVLLISVDGLHALDVANFVQSHPNSALAELSGHGVTYSNLVVAFVVCQTVDDSDGLRPRR